MLNFHKSGDGEIFPLYHSSAFTPAAQCSGVEDCWSISFSLKPEEDLKRTGKHR